MNNTIVDFLTTGQFESLAFGMSLRHTRKTLGVPQLSGSDPVLRKYKDLQIGFERNFLISVVIDYPKVGEPELPEPLWIGQNPPPSKSGVSEFTKYLENNEIPFKTEYQYNFEGAIYLKTNSGVVIIFNGEKLVTLQRIVGLL